MYWTSIFSEVYLEDASRSLADAPTGLLCRSVAPGLLTNSSFLLHPIKTERIKATFRKVFIFDTFVYGYNFPKTVPIVSRKDAFSILTFRTYGAIDNCFSRRHQYVAPLGHQGIQHRKRSPNYRLTVHDSISLYPVRYKNICISCSAIIAVAAED